MTAASLARSPLAQAQAGDAALAEALFREGKALMKAGKYDEACPKLAESNRVDPATGTLLALAFCHEKQGKSATAWAEYNEVAAAAASKGNAERGLVARERIAELERRLSKLTVIVSAEAASLPGLRITCDGTPWGQPSWGSAVPVDPGDHLILATADHRKPLSRSVHLGAAADRQSISISTLDEEAPPALPRAAPVPAAAPPSSPSRAAGPAETRSGGAPGAGGTEAGRRPVPASAYVAGAAFAAAAASFTYFGLSGRAEYFDLKSSCGPDCAKSTVAATHTKLVVADVSLAVSVVALGAAAYFFFTRPYVADAAPRAAAKVVRFDVRADARAAGASVGLVF